MIDLRFIEETEGVKEATGKIRKSILFILDEV